jgi:RNA polymerase sigma-70 factor (ECF subfamily)
LVIEAGRIALRQPQRVATDQSGFDEFFALRYEQTLGLVTLATGDRALAEDATQEAFARAFNRWRTVSVMSHPDRWVARVAINLAIDHLRKTSRESSIDTLIEAPPHDQVEELWVRWNLDRLTPMQRATVICRYMDGMPVDEVALAMGRSPQTIKTHLRLARGRLRGFLAEESR